MDWPCLAPHAEGAALDLKVSPNAAKTSLQGLVGSRLKVRLQAPPVEGKANEALRAWAAVVFGLRSRDVEILQGERGTSKRLLLRGISVEAAAGALDRAAE